MTRKAELAKSKMGTIDRLTTRNKKQPNFDDPPKCKVLVKKNTILEANTESIDNCGNIPHKKKDLENNKISVNHSGNIQQKKKKRILGQRITKTEMHKKIDYESRDDINKVKVTVNISGGLEDTHTDRISHDDSNEMQSVPTLNSHVESNDHTLNSRLLSNDLTYNDTDVDSEVSEDEDNETITTEDDIAKQKEDMNMEIYKQIASIFKGGKEVYYEEFGEPDVLKLHSSIPDFLAPNKVVIRIEASTISLSDCELRRNMNRKIFSSIPLPQLVGQDMIGRIVHVGEKVKQNSSFKVGDRVCSLHEFLGGNSRYITLPPSRLVRVPDNVDVAKAACIVRTYLAAYQILYRTGVFEADNSQRILVCGANGNIGRAVIELAKVSRAKVYGASRSRHRDFVEGRLGVPWVHSDPQRWSKLKNIDAVIDCVNYTGNFSDSKLPLKSTGVLICVGSSKMVRDTIRRQKKLNEDVQYDSDEEPISSMCGACGTISKKEAVYQTDILSNVLSHITPKDMSLSIFIKQVSYDLFYNVEKHWDGCKEDLEYLFLMLQRGKINPKVQHRVALNEVAVSHKLIESGGLQGAIVCVDDKTNSLTT